MDKKRISLLVVVALLVLSSFLAISRAPGLEEKALMGTRTDVAGIAFEQLLALDKTDSRLERVAKNTVNWSYTNWQGMSFGLVFGATLLTLLQSIPLWSFSSNRFIAAFQGMLGGAPLGVCVNCATPVGHSMQRAGVRAETYLATMMSSPTLNIIVITMMIALLQPHIVAVKVIATLLFILLVVPFLVRLSESETNIAATADTGSWKVPEVSTHWGKTVRLTARDWLTNLMFIIRITVPLMLLAGLLGSVLIEFVSLDEIAGMPVAISSYVMIALVGTLLPIPIAFDVVLTAALLSAGFPVGLAMTLFFSLGIFSLFPAMLLARDVSVRFSLTLVCGVAMFAAIAGFLTETIHDRVVEQQEQSLEASLQTLAKNSRIRTLENQLKLADQLCHQVMAEDALCMEELIREEAFGITTRQLCDDMYDIDVAAARLCEEVVKERALTQRAIDSGDIKLCERFECRQHYLDHYAYLPGSLQTCETAVPDPAPCRFSLVQRRILYFRSEDACAPLSGVEREVCRNELQLLLVTDQMDLQLCDTLPGHLRDECTIRFISTHLAESGTFECEQLSTGKAALCREAKMQQAATSTDDPATCPAEPAPLAELCKLNAVAAKIRNVSTDESGLDVGKTDGPSRSPLLIEPVALPEAVGLQRLGTGRRIVVESVALNSRGDTQGKFIRRNASETGLAHSWSMSGTDLFEPFAYGKGLAAGDINQDGYPDLAVAFEKGIFLYSNLGQGRFAVTHELRPDDDFDAFLVVLLDVDNDGALDLFASAYGGKRVIYLNRDGDFDTQLAIPQGDAPLTMAAGFADLDADADLDMVLGNWSYGVERNFNTAGAANELLENRVTHLKAVNTFSAEPPGQTLSVLLTDFNGDKLTDMVIGNDRQVPDMFYQGTGGLTFDLVPAGPVEETSLNTMSYESADFNNDLRLDLFSTDMLFEASGRNDYCAEIDDSDAEQSCRILTRVESIIGQGRADYCHDLGSQVQDCIASVVLELAIREQRPELCQRIPREYPTKRNYCDLVTRELSPIPDVELSLYPAQLTSNKLHLGQASGSFADVSQQAGITRSNWAWNARALDMDSDGDQDIYIGNGTGLGAADRSTFIPDIQVHSNILYANEANGQFRSAAAEFGLEDFSNTASFVSLDADLDGDLDLVTYGQVTGLRFYENTVNDNNNVTISLRDKIGNSHCIGCIVTIRTSAGEQMRELKLSGGYLSYDEPQVHFGLGTADAVEEIRIRWSTGDQSRLRQIFPANHHYRITRSP